MERINKIHRQVSVICVANRGSQSEVTHHNVSRTTRPIASARRKSCQGRNWRHAARVLGEGVTQGLAPEWRSYAEREALPLHLRSKRPLRTSGVTLQCHLWNPLFSATSSICRPPWCGTC